MSHTIESAASAPLVVAITGASGVTYGIRILDLLKAQHIESHLVISKAGLRTLHEEMQLGLKDIEGLATVVHPSTDIGASIASGSFKTRGMVIAPCSVRTLGEIVTGVTSSLVSRAADVALKERRRVVLMLRETPLHHGHISNMLKATEMGAIIAPPVPAFYSRPKDLDDMVTQTSARMLDLFDINAPDLRRWTGSAAADQ